MLVFVVIFILLAAVMIAYLIKSRMENGEFDRKPPLIKDGQKSRKNTDEGTEMRGAAVDIDKAKKHRQSPHKYRPIGEFETKGKTTTGTEVVGKATLDRPEAQRKRQSPLNMFKK